VIATLARSGWLATPSAYGSWGWDVINKDLHVLLPLTPRKVCVSSWVLERLEFHFPSEGYFPRVPVFFFHYGKPFKSSYNNYRKNVINEKE
jgi:hypothetical protein